MTIFLQQLIFNVICRPAFHFLVLLLLLPGLSGCTGKLNRASQYFYAGQPQQALELLETGDSIGNRSQLLFLLEKGLVLHQLGEYQQSIEPLLQAARLVEQFESISVSEQTASLVTNEWLTRYKGEYSERLWIHSYLMMNFLLLGQFDSALVEARRALTSMERSPQALADDYFTRTLIALCFANLAEHNDAYLVYRKLADDLVDPAAVAADIVWHAERMGMLDEVEKFRPLIPYELPDGDTELVLFVAAGRIPVKRPGNIFLPPAIRFSFPYYDNKVGARPQYRILPAVWNALPLLTTSLGEVARDALEARKIRIIAKATARVAVKESFARAVGDNNDAAVEALVRIAMFLLEEPDTRSWQLLPGYLTLLRIPLPAGRHKLQLELKASASAPRQIIDLPEVQLRHGQRVFHAIRF